MSSAKTKNRSVSKVRYLHNLVVLAKADGQIVDRERDFLKRKSLELGIEDDVLQSLLTEAESLTTPIMETIDERLELMTDCIKMAAIDGVISEEEKAFCNKICDLLQLDESFVQEITETHNISVE